MKLSADAKIFMEDGKEIGKLNRFVIDPRTKQVTHIVFGRGLLSNDERLVPVQLIDHVDDQGIHLGHLPVGEPNELPSFQEMDYVITDEKTFLERGFEGDDAVRSYYYYPPAPYGAPGILRADDSLINSPSSTARWPIETGIPQTGEQSVVRQENQNIPDGTVALKEGAKVFTSEHKHVGNIEKVIMQPDTLQATHIVITRGLLLKERKLVPASWIDDVGENEVSLAVDADFASRLPDYIEKNE